MALPQILHLLKLLLAAVVTTSGAILAASLQGAVVLPPSVVAILTSIVSVGAGLGIASGGVEAPKSPPPPPVGQ
jgi:hypothetical protein